VNASGKPLPQELERRPLGRFAAVASAVSQWCDRHPALFFTLLSAWYLVLVWKLAARPLWFDELTTFYIARQPTVARMMEALRSVDLNPPLNYFLTRWSVALLGTAPWATRLPALIAFWGGSAAIFALMRRRASSLVAAVGVLLFWSSPYFSYAAEARPYGLLLGLSTILLWAWDPPTNGVPKKRLAWVAIAGGLLLLAHVFGVLSLGSVWFGEAVRSYRRRRVDWPMAAALLFPLIATLTYGPMFRALHGAVFSPEAQVTWGKLGFLYYAVFRWMWRPLLVIAVFALLALRRRRRVGLAQHAVQVASFVPGSPDEKVYSRYAPEMSAVLAVLFLVPVGLTILFLRSHGAFYDRYGMAITIPIVLVAPLLVQWWMRADVRVALSAFCLIASLLLLSTTLRNPVSQAANAVMPARTATKFTGILMTSPHGPFRPWWKKLPVPAELLRERDQARLLKSLDGFYPELPLVAASELTFVEMDHRESATLTSRLFYLYDRNAEMTLGHRPVTDSLMVLKDFFPFRGRLASYGEFVDEQRRFLVIGSYEHPGDWLLRQAEADGATLQIIGRYEGYADSELYLLTYPANHK
jgi:hypothetical protein